jgi:predicted nucleic acid-binding protein
VRRIVIDASVALKWFLADEEDGESALDILDSCASGRIALHGPALLEFEVANGLAIAKRKARVGDAIALKAMEGFTELGIELHPLAPLFPKVLDSCNKYNISAYDASYLALADDLKADLVTADKRLFNATRPLELVSLIGNFRV